MIHFIWKNWWRKKERLILLLVGVLIISVGLAYLIALSETNKGTVVNELEERWSSSYDIVVRPAGARSNTEQDDLLNPNYLSGIDGGISMEQYETIKQITNVDVAAPIAMIGNVLYATYLEQFELEDGIYKMTKEVVTNDGVHTEKENSQYYFPAGNLKEQVLDKMSQKEDFGADYYLKPYDEYVTDYRRFLIAGIDPEQEARLTGLDEAVTSKGESRYLKRSDELNMEEIYGDDESKEHDALLHFPVLINNHTYANQNLNWKIERLNVPYEKEKAEEMLDELEEKGGEKYLDTLKGETIHNYAFSEQEIYSRMVNSIAGFDRLTGEPFEKNYLQTDSFDMDRRTFSERPSSLVYDPITSPFPDKWNNAYQLQTFTKDSLESFRRSIDYGVDNENEHASYTYIHPEWVGFYNPEKLDIAMDPLNELPMETYRPAGAELVLDATRNPINPPKKLKPTYDPYGFLANPPTMLTTLEAAEAFSGEEPISAIRIKVSGVSELSEDSQETIEQVANDIEKRTGLITDITLGSSPQLTLINVPKLESKHRKEEELGWFQQSWIKLGSSVSIFHETKVGFSGLILSIIAVAVIYVWATSLVSLLARQKEFSVLLSIGWRPGQLSKLLFMESAILGGIVAIISWLVLIIVTITKNTSFEPERILLTGFIGFLIYILGAIIPAFTAHKITPYEAIQTGEISKLSNRLIRTRGIISMAVNHFTGKWKRSVLSIISMALPTSLLAIFLFITFRLEGVMYLSLIGEYVALEVGSVHYAAMGIALIIAVLTTAEIMWQNIAERQEEIALLKAIGWKNKSVRMLIWMEGLLNGFIAAVIGISLALLIQYTMYNEISGEGLKFVLATGIVPIVVGLLGTVLPAERAVRILPVRGMK